MSNKLFGLLIGIFLAVTVQAATLESDITAQGVDSYIGQHVSAAQLATTLRTYGTLTAASTLTYSNCGTVYTLNSATEFATTLPSPIAGCYFKFIVLAAPASASYTVVTASSANIINGQVASAEDAAGSVSTAAAADTITFVDSKAIRGDYVELFSDGTYWFVSGMCNVQDGITTTQAT